DENMLKRRNVS
nr:Chain A, IMPORTIN ALPHA-2 SUBUNIT [synthetic construct]1IQ1_B Chain B, IMPORTIN ALPHA-2 SUBUNIT [synthetic construct]